MLAIMTSETTQKLPTYGGQAVIEGVMMRGAQTVAIAVRDPQGTIQINAQPLSAAYRHPILKLPFLRGMLGIWDALGLGTRALLYSANVAAGEQASLEGPVAYGTLAVSLGLGLGLFFVLPALAGSGLQHWMQWPVWASNLAEGVARLFLVVGYMWAIGQLADVRRLFGYHGAEHKTINAFEAGAELTPESVARFPIEHPRCGTAFLLMVVVFSVLLFSLLGDLSLPARIATRLLFLPVLAGLAYEYLQFTARHFKNPLIRALVLPNLALQRLTTREPDHEMLAVAIAAFQAMRRAEL